MRCCFPSDRLSEVDRGSLAEVDRGRHGHREGHAGIAGVPLNGEDQDRDRAREHDREPSEAGEVHAHILPGTEDGLRRRRSGGGRAVGTRERPKSPGGAVIDFRKLRKFGSSFTPGTPRYWQEWLLVAEIGPRTVRRPC